MKKIFILTLLIGLTFNIAAQIKSGEIVYDIKMKGVPAEQAEMMGDMEMTIIFNQDFVKTSFDMGMVKTTAIANAKTQTTTTLMDMIGNKIMFDITEEDAIEQQKEIEGKGIEVDVRDFTKDIAGYKCKKAIVTIEGVDVVIYFTNEIEVPRVKSSTTNQFDFSMIDGCPLMFSVSQNGMNMEFTATKVEDKKIKDSEFDIPEGYEKMSQEQLKMMGLGN